MKIQDILSKHSTVGVIGNRNTAKSSLVLTKLLELRKDYPTLKIAVMGVEPTLYPILEKNNITIIQSKMDILDLQMRDTLIYIDEFALFFSTRNKSKEIEKLERFLDRIEHQNCKLIVSTAREGYFNKFMCSRISAFLVKEIEYTALVNGTWLNERVKAVNSTSDYRLECDKDTYFTVTNKEGITTKHTFEYNKELDSKKENADIFAKKIAKNNAKESRFKKGFVTVLNQKDSST